MGEDRSSPRRFIRYRRNAEIELNTPRGLCAATLLDYSPFGVKIRSASPLEHKESVEVIYNGISSKGRVVWLRGDMAGIEFSPPFAGLLADYTLSDLLIGLKLSEKTGMLKITSGEVQKILYTKSGNPHLAQSNVREERLGEVLIRTGKITRDAYDRSIGIMNKTGKRYGNVLVELGFIKASELVSAVRTQVQEIIINAFKIIDGNFKFDEGSSAMTETVDIQLSLATLIYRGIKGIDDTRYLEKLFSDQNAILIPSGDPFHLYQEIPFTDQERDLLLLVDGRNTIRDILKNASAKNTETLKTIHAFFSARILEMKTESAVSEETPIEEVLEAKTVDSQFVRETETLFERFEDMDFYELLDVPRGASPHDIKAAYHRKVKQYHPDRHFVIERDDIKDKISRIFARITEAYTVLSKHHARQEYDSYKKKKESPADIARSKFKEGLELYRRGRYEDARQTFGQAIYIDDSHHEYHYYHGLSLRRFKKYKEAEQAFLQAIRKAPDRDDYIAELGHVYLELGLQLRARRTFERSLAISADNERALQGMADLGEKADF